MELNFTRPPTWMDDAACASTIDDTMWFPTTGHAPQAVARAKRICSDCPVSLACLQYAIDTAAEGIWAGTTPEQRNKLRAAS